MTAWIKMMSTQFIMFNALLQMKLQTPNTTVQVLNNFVFVCVINFFAKQALWLKVFQSY